MTEVNPPAGGRTIALFPGAFKPPHVNHFETVRYLAQRGDIDEVVVIIANRSRPIPGSTKALGVDVAKHVWAIYLQHMSTVRVEVAASSAVSHALDLVDRARPGDNVLLVFGREDATNGRTRFGKMRTREPPPQVTVSTIEGSADVAPVRATQLRAHLAVESGRADFMAGLPAHLSEAEQGEVWTICRQAMVDQRELTVRRIAAVVEERGLGLRAPLVAATPGKRDEVFRATLTDGARAFIKDANDTIASDNDSGAGYGRKPRRRLKAEREALEWLRRSVATSVQVPEILFYDRSTRMLALTEVCPGGHSLTEDLRRGSFDPSFASGAARFLVAAHTSTKIPPPFWDDAWRDLQQWRRMLCTVTTGDLFPKLPRHIQTDLMDLRDASDESRTPGFRHLDFSSSNLMTHGHQVGVIDFESSTNVGDPAYDLGTLLASYLVAALDVDASDGCRAAVTAAVASYRAGVGDRWEAMATRVLGFAAAGLVYDSSRRAPRSSPEIGQRLFATAGYLLSKSREVGCPEVSVVLSEALDFGRPVRRGRSLHGTAQSESSRTVRRRWLTSRDPNGHWEGSVVSTAGQDDLTIEILGGEPHTIVDIHLDGTSIGAVDLDAVGSAELRVAPGRDGSRIEVRNDTRVVLDGTSPNETRG